MLIIVDDNRGIFLIDLTPEQCDQIRLSILAARECGFRAMMELAEEVHIDIRCIRSYPILQMDWNELTFLLAVMAYQATEKTTRQNAQVLDEIVETLTCALEMAIV